jgi:DNA-binding NtrC family response regulator
MAAETTPLSGCDVLLLEDDDILRERLSAYLRRAGAEVSACARLAEARRLAGEIRFDFALVDLHVPDGEALALLREGVFSENTGVVVMTAYGGIEKAVEAMRLGAGDYLAKPFEPPELSLAFLRCRATRRGERRDEQRAQGSADGLPVFFFGETLAPIRAQLETILVAERRLERRLPPVLIEGETGTGKTMLARWLHLQGPRATGPFVAINCAALPETLAESELFGHERGAFTDAKRARIGLFEAADGGTLFLDEIGALAPGTQAKLLIAVEEGMIRRLGGVKGIPTDARIIAASNRPLADLVAAGTFREDLLHRLTLLRLELLPLRQRGADVLALARHLLTRLGDRYRRPNVHLTPAGEARLRAQLWPGNVRQLAHELERAIIFAGDNGALDLAHLGEPPSAPPDSWRNPTWRMPESGFSLERVEAELIAEALRESANNVSAAARRLGVTREFLRYRLEGERPKAHGNQP